jgi:hypothetical protein
MDVCSGPFFAGRDAVASGGVVSPAFVGVVAGVCVPPDFGMTVFGMLVGGMSGLYTLLSWANAGADNSNIATTSLYIFPPWNWFITNPNEGPTTSSLCETIDRAESAAAID